MASRDVPDNPLIGALRLAFDRLIAAGEVDLNTLPETGETEVQADNWTLHLEGWPVTTAWIAIDQDPQSPKEQMTALDQTFDHRARAALHDADRRLDGVLLRGLRESGDDLSVRLVELLEAAGVDAGSDDPKRLGLLPTFQCR